jgi:type II secretory pathway predicted ATPase ExeA
VHLASRGIPRLVNQICDYALVYAFTDGLDKVDAGVIEQVVTDRRTHGNLKMTAG